MPAQALVGLLWEGGGGGLLCCVFFNAVVKGGLEFVLMFVLLSLHWFQKHKFEIDRNTLFELTLILSLN